MEKVKGSITKVELFDSYKLGDKGRFELFSLENIYYAFGFI